MGNAKEETAVHQRTNDPVFEEGFTFLVRNPKTQELMVEVGFLSFGSGRPTIFVVRPR